MLKAFHKEETRMPTQTPAGGLMAASTLTNKNINQDAFALARNLQVPLNGIVIADGVGSHYGAEIASEIAVLAVKDALEDIASPSDVDLTCLFGSAQQRLAGYVDVHIAEFPENLNWQHAFGTTVLCVVETPVEIAIGYLGNGAIFHIRGNFNTFPPTQLLPWTVASYLNPHSLPYEGKNLLYKLLSARGKSAGTPPSVLSLRKDLD